MLRRQVTKILLNSLSSDCVTAVTGGYEIKGFGPIYTADVADCTYACKSDGTLQVTNVAVVIPETCECPYTWEMTTVCQPSLEDGTNYEINNTFTIRRLYQYEDPSGATPTATATANAIAAMINADPNACVTAESNAINPSVTAGTIKLTAKYAAKPFLVATPSGTVTYSTAGVTPLMSDTWMAKQFPLQMGSFGSQPTVAIPGVDYCLFRFVLKTTTQDISAANHYNDYLAEVEFYVNSAAGAGYTAWLNAMSVLMPDCDTWS